MEIENSSNRSKSKKYGSRKTTGRVEPEEKQNKAIKDVEDDDDKEIEKEGKNLKNSLSSKKEIEEEEEIQDEDENKELSMEIDSSNISNTETDGIEEVEKEEEEIKENEGEEEEEDDDSEEEVYRAPIIDSRNISFTTKTLNPFLTCTLCSGYFKDAYTIVECLHTYCKSCIYSYLCKHHECPQCGVQLGGNPHEKIRFDRQIHSFVSKVFPDLDKKDVEAERIMLGLPDEEPVNQNDQKQDAEENRPKKKLRKSDALKKFYSDEIGFELNLDENEKEELLKKLDKPFIRTSAKVTIKHLKKYLQKKIEVQDIKDLEITYRGEILGNEHSLEYILKTRGLETSNKNPNFKYRIRIDEHHNIF